MRPSGIAFGAAAGLAVGGAVDLKKYDAAAAELREAAALDPADMPTWFEIGRLAAITGNGLPEGKKALEKYLAYTPAKGEPTREQAAAYLKQIRQRQARMTVR